VYERYDLPALVGVQFSFQVESELDPRKTNNSQVLVLLEASKTALVPFPMRNEGTEEGKKRSKRGAMRLMYAILPFMSAYVALPLLPQTEIGQKAMGEEMKGDTSTIFSNI
jgi:hypothetical protein